MVVCNFRAPATAVPPLALHTFRGELNFMARKYVNRKWRREERGEPVRYAFVYVVRGTAERGTSNSRILPQVSTFISNLTLWRNIAP